MLRGIITAPAKIDKLPNGFTIRGLITPEEIRYLLLYWDKIIIPDNHMISHRVPEEDILIDCGAIERPLGGSVGGAFAFGVNMAEAVLAAQSSVMNEALLDKDIDWVLHQYGADLHILPEDMEQRNTIRFDLLNSLPVPPSSVPIHEILDFKARRKDEFLALHNTLDEYYLSVLDSPDRNLSRLRVIAELNSALENIMAVSGEKFDIKKKFNLSVQFNVGGDKMVIGAAAAAHIMREFSLPFSVSLGAATGALMSCLNIKAERADTISKASTRTKLSYLSSGVSEQVLNILK